VGRRSGLRATDDGREQLWTVRQPPATLVSQSTRVFSAPTSFLAEETWIADCSSPSSCHHFPFGEQASCCHSAKQTLALFGRCSNLHPCSTNNLDVNDLGSLTLLLLPPATLLNFARYVLIASRCRSTCFQLLIHCIVSTTTRPFTHVHTTFLLTWLQKL